MPTLPTPTTPYYGGGQVQNPCDVLVDSGVPSTKAVDHGLGTLYVDKDATDAYLLLSKAGGVATWEKLATGESGFPITQFVVGPSGEAGYQTIQSAITAASAAGGGDVYIQPGSYTESLTLAADVNLIGTDPEAITITGVHTPPAGAGSVCFENINFVSATDVLSSAEASPCKIKFVNCSFDVTNGFVCDVNDWLGSITIIQCTSIGTADGIINNAGGGADIVIRDSDLGAGTSNVMATAGTCTFHSVSIVCPWTTASGTVFTCDNCQFFETITNGGDSNGVFSNGRFVTGANPIMTQSSSGTVEIYNCYIESTASPAFQGAGAGVIFIGTGTFGGNSSFAGTLSTQFEETVCGDLTVNNVISVQSGTVTDFCGSFQLTAGTQTIANTNITANDQIYLQVKDVNGSTALGILTYSITPSTSFTITSVQAGTPASTQTNDVSIGEYLIIRRF